MSDRESAESRVLQHHARSFAAQTRGSAPAWLQVLRRDAMRQFQDLGFPTTRSEEWRYTSVSRIARHPFNWAASPSLPTESEWDDLRM